MRVRWLGNREAGVTECLDYCTPGQRPILASRLGFAFESEERANK
jgi:hypothetical protein